MSSRDVERNATHGQERVSLHVLSAMTNFSTLVASYCNSEVSGLPRVVFVIAFDTGHCCIDPTSLCYFPQP